MSRFRRFQLLVLCAGLLSEGQGQEYKQASTSDPTELSLEELVNIQVDSVSAASKYEQKVTQAPASVSIVTSDEIKKFGYRSVADVLRGMRGFFVWDDCSYSYPGSQGFQRPGDFNTRYLFLIDGHRMNDNIFSASEVGNDLPLDIDLIDRVEVIRGPSSSIYGNNAFLGVINIVTKTGRQINGLEGSVEGGAFDTYKQRFSFGKKFANDVEWLFSGSHQTSGGQEQLYYPEFDQRISNDPRARNNGLALNSDGEETHQFFTSATYHDFTLTGLYSSHTKDLPTAPFGSFFGGGLAQTKDERAFAELKYNHQFDEGTELSGRFSYDVFPHIGSYPYDYAGNNRPADIVMDYDGDFGDWLTTEVQLKRRLFDRHTVMVGAEYRENLNQHLFNYDSQNTTFVEDQRKSRSFGAFTEIEAVLRTNLLLNAGLRYDYYDTFGGTVNPRIGLIYNPWEQTTFKLLYGQAFRAPNDYELYYGSAAFGQVPNPDLNPETIRTYQFIYEQYLPAHLRFSASAYYYKIDDLVSQTIQPGTGLSIFENVDRVEAKGMEYELEGKYPGGLLARVSYALQRTEDGSTGQELNNSPRHLAKFNLILPIYQDYLFGGLELQYSSSLKTLANGRTSGYLIANLTLYSQKLAKNLEISATIYNLFDRQYAFPGGPGHLQAVIPQDGRSFRTKLTYRF